MVGDALAGHRPRGLCDRPRVGDRPVSLACRDVVGVVRLGTAIMRHLSVSRKALVSTTSHGRVTLDERVITLADLNTPIENLQGSYVKLFEREFRLGSALAETNQQLGLGA